MSVTVLIPSALARFAGNSEKVETSGNRVGAVLKGLVDLHPGLKKHLFGDNGQLRKYVNVYLGEDDIRRLRGMETPVKEGQELTILPSIAGGVGVAEPSTNGATSLSKEEILRYSRHLIMPEVALEGQKKLKASSVLCIGAGGLGSPLAMYLAAAGVGTIGIVDFDVVDLTNLQRQIIHGQEDVGRPKLDSARDTLKGINPHINVVGFETALSSDNAMNILKDFDIVVDGTDNFPTRYLVNDACVLLGKPNVYGSIFRFEGQASVFWAERGPCYRCLYPEPPPPGMVPSCAEGGVLGILPGAIGVIQATEAVKLILGSGEPLIGRLLLFNALQMKFRELKLRKDPDCPICGANPTIKELIDYQEFCGIRPAPVIPAAELANTEMSVTELKSRFDQGERPTLIDVREPYELEIAAIPYSRLIPQNEVPERYHELNADEEIVVMCRSGQRSGRIAEFLRGKGFKNVKNLKGGVLAWSDEIDSTVAKY